MLKVTVTGAGTGAPPLLVAHGLFGSARNWGVIAKRLSEARQVLTVDMRNHGESPWAPTQGYGDMAADLAEVIAAHGGRADVLGHSMGGKAAMRLALEHPQAVRRLIVADIAPVAYGHSQAHLVRAMRGLDLTGLTQRSEADRRLAASVEDAGVRAFLLQSLDLRAQPPRWRLNLDVLEAEMDRITGWEEVAGRFEGPALFLSGALSSYVLPEHRERIRTLFPRARFARIPGAGHWLHADRPREVEAAVAAFLDAPGG
ncbi:MAG: alpha/beta fold hydrolase [Rhodobacteraceae bacterium]|nr:alpha/beta fold hydrolase [Paracoccaceae bacterium]